MNEIVRKIILTLLIINIVAASIYLISIEVDEHKTRNLNEDLRNLYTATVTLGVSEPAEAEADSTTAVQPISEDAEPELEPELEPETPSTTVSEVTESVLEPLVMRDNMVNFYNENSETAGWLTLGGTKIDNVVVQTKDNDKYLHTNFYGKESQPGTLFVDYRCVVNDYGFNQSDNIVIYGHKQKDGEMFGTLSNYHNNLEFYKQYPTFTFSNLYEEYTYKIIGYFVCRTEPSIFNPEEEIFDYHNYINFYNDTRFSFGNFIHNVKSRSEISTPVGFTLDDQFMTLSTCAYDYPNARFVVVARKVRSDETTEVDVKLAAINKYAVK